MRHLLRIDDLTVQEIEDLFIRTKVMKDKKKRGVAHRSLGGKVLALVFEKASTRTRVSFEVGIHELGGLPIYLNAKDLSQLSHVAVVGHNRNAKNRTIGECANVHP